MPERLSDPQEPDLLARQAGKDLYNSKVGVLRRVELWRLGNLWGLNFPVGASKDFMLPFFQQLEAEGKDPLRPPSGAVHGTADLRTRDVKYSDQSHIEKVPDTTDFEQRLMAQPMHQLKKICKLRGIPQSPKDLKVALVKRIIEASEGNDQDTLGGGQ